VWPWRHNALSARRLSTAVRPLRSDVRPLAARFTHTKAGLGGNPLHLALPAARHWRQ
jgi:hypothetical protein